MFDVLIYYKNEKVFDGPYKYTSAFVDWMFDTIGIGAHQKNFIDEHQFYYYYELGEMIFTFRKESDAIKFKEKWLKND